MKISDIKGEAVFSTIAEIIDPIMRIAEDEAAVELFKRKKTPEGMEAKDFFIKRAKAALPALINNHRTDVIAILAAVNQETPEEYAKELTFMKLFNDVIEIFKDDELLSFFR